MSDVQVIQIPDYAVYKTLLESTKAIPWKIDWGSMQFAYIGPQIEQLLGWAPDSWVSVEDWATRMHSEDRDWVVNFCVTQSQAGVDHEADYRALTKDGDYVWIRDVVHVVRKDNGEVDSLVGFMFDYFKQYNDHYGHIQGDECLKEVSRLLSSGATRSRDFLARYGGEEFVLILPETDNDAARKVAERCRQLIFKAQIDHAQSDVSHVLTISLGVGSIQPSRSDEATPFIEKVDKLLYRAKQEGRNRIMAGS